MKTVWINARFLDRPVTGVERVARELLGALARDALDAEGRLADGTRVALLAPAGGHAHSPWPQLELVRAGRLGGHAWEQLELPWLTRGELLLSLCNTGPALKREHLVFLHDAQTFAIPEAFSPAFGFWYRTLFRTLGRSAHTVLVNSRFTQAELTRHAGIDPQRMQRIRFGTEHAVRGTAAALDALELPDQPWLLAFASGNPNKNFAIVLEALELLGEAAPPCVVVGAASERVFRTSGVDAERLHHVGRVDDAQLRSLYHGALALAFPSHYEGFGLPPLEAMANGCPVIASRTGALPETTGSAALFCDPQDPASLARAIAELAADPALRALCKDHGLAHSAGCSWSAGARDLIHAIEGALTSAPDSTDLSPTPDGVDL